VHHVRFTAAEELGELLGDGALVNSFHHQAVERLGAGVIRIAEASDGVCEAIAAGPRVRGVQWHPEFHAEQPDPVFCWLIETARAAARDRGGVAR
jgi:putative glutamine amidotransferase